MSICRPAPSPRTAPEGCSKGRDPASRPQRGSGRRIPRKSRLTAHVAKGIYLHQQGDESDNSHHHHRDGVDRHAKIEHPTPRLEPRSRKLARRSIQQVVKKEPEKYEPEAYGSDGNVRALPREIPPEKGQRSERAHAGRGSQPRPLQPDCFGSVHEARGHHFIRLSSSTFTEDRFLYNLSTMPSASPTSAAAMVMTKIANMKPRCFSVSPSAPGTSKRQ